ncbi:MAG TPA: thioredoxin family protein [Chitinophagaceae bacterium]|nr:thioredoxin family protein [Chitinophagaceae bacterium]MCB9056072.1 thioredoxin family protein [Chitinophagales bacterium]HPG10740.1 thioredoxin family protein [Chitinophagaceae bacterium]HRX94896.1 thioredoxin family protein [Chitinophagaceae bacterium]
MKKTLFSALPIVAIAALTVMPVIDPLPIGSPMPNPQLKMKSTSGSMVSFADAKKENGLLVMFSCNTCPYVIKNQERTREVCAYALKNNIGVVILNPNEANRDNQDSYSAMQEYATDNGYKWDYLVDENSVMADAFGANRTPECYLFDNDNKLVYHGAIDDNPSNASAVNRQHLKVAMDEMKGGSDISVKESKSVGCSIKRL